MASRELISSVSKPKKKYTFGQKVGDAWLASVDTMLSPIPGLNQIIQDDMYANEKMADFQNKVSNIYSPIAGAALGVATGGTSSMLGVGQGTPLANQQVGPPEFDYNQLAYGGRRMKANGGMLTKFEGPAHEQGGIQLGQDEVEGSETMFAMGGENNSDFIFSDRIFVHKPNKKGELKPTKQTFADRSKRISAKYKLRPNDPYGKKSEELELNKLASKQEALKEIMNPQPQGNMMAMGGKKYYGGGIYKDTDSPVFDQNQILLNDSSNFLMGNIPSANREKLSTSMFEPAVESESYVDDIPFNTGDVVTGLNKDNSYQSNFGIPALGYAAQALTNIPAMFMKPETKNFSRVKFDDISLAEQRNAARRARNLGLASARGIAAQSSDMGQAMNYLSGTTAGLNSAYGNQFNESLMQEKQMNLQSNMKEQLANSEIEMYEEDINTKETDAIRNLKMQALSNIGTSAAMAGKSYMDMEIENNKLGVLAKTNPYYTIDANGNVIPKKAFGGVRNKYATGGPKRRYPQNNAEAAALLAPNPEPGFSMMERPNPELGMLVDPTKHPLYPNYPDRTYSGGTLPLTTIVAGNTPTYRGDDESRRVDARTLPGYGKLNDRGVLSSTPQNWGVYPERVRASMMGASVQDRADYLGIQDFMTAAAAPAGAVKLGLAARTAIGLGMFGAGTAAQYSDDESLREVGQYGQIFGAAEALPGIGKGASVLAGKIKPSVPIIKEFLKKTPYWAKKASTATGNFIKTNPRLVGYPTIVGGKYGYNKVSSNKKETATRKKALLDDTKAMEEEILKQLNGGK